VGQIIEACRNMNEEELRVEEQKNVEDLCIDGCIKMVPK
jgi:hypothetical protein